MEKVKFLIVGAGPCGLGAAWRFQELDCEDFLIIDREAQAGGLARSFVDDKGFTWDIGGHVQFSHYEDFDRVMDEVLPGQWYEHQRESWVWIEDRFVPYPFQNNIHRLSEQTRDLCLKGLVDLQSTPSKPLKNFKDWILQSFGEGIASHFLLPYNEKVWAFPPQKMNFQWIGERVAQVNLERILENIEFNRDDVAWGPNSCFRFPKEGGTGRIWKEVAARIRPEKLRLSSDVVGINLKQKQLRLKSGEVFSYERLLSTIPLNRLLQLSDLPSAKEPLHSNSHIVGVGLRGELPQALRTKCWIYFPEANCPFYRATVFSNYSPAHVPEGGGYWSLMCETASSADRPIDEARIVEDTIQGLRNTNMISREHEIVSRWSFSAKPGYPTPFLERDEWVRSNQERLSSFSVDSRGRFGNWFYEVSNQDHSFMQGFEWANAKLKGTPEVTAFRPQIVNAPGKREALPSSWCA